MSKAKLEKLIKVSRKCGEAENPKGFFENPKHATKFFFNLAAIEGSAPAEVVAVFLSVDALKGLKKYIKIVRAHTYHEELSVEFKKMKDVLESAIYFAASYKEGETDRLEKELGPIITSAINIATTINSLNIEDDEDDDDLGFNTEIDPDAPVSGTWLSGTALDTAATTEEEQQ